MRNWLIFGGLGVVAFFVWTKRAAAASAGPNPAVVGFIGQQQGPGGMVTGCSFARAGGTLIDVMTGKALSEDEAARRAKAEGCTVPPKPTKATKPGQSIFPTGGK